jgi:hypothetical protein
MTTTPDNVKPGSPLDVALQAAARAGVNRQLVDGRWRYNLTLDNLAEVAGAVHLGVADATAGPTPTQARLQLLDALIAGVHHLERDAATVELANRGVLHLHTTDQVETWLIEERAIAATATLGGLSAHEHPAWAAGVRWAAAELDAQAEGRETLPMIDHTDHLRICAGDPERHSRVPRDQAPTKHVHDED